MNGRRIVFCQREPLGGVGTNPGSPVPGFLEKAGFTVTLTNDDAAAIPREGLLWLHANAAWYPKILHELRRMPREQRPRVVIWHIEPLPPPRDSGLPYPWLSMREIAKIVLRDLRATDVYTNWLTLERLHRAGIPDVLAVSAPARQRFLQERGIAAHCVPVGYYPEMGRDLGIARDIDVLFLGALDVPRRNRMLGALRKQGINVLAVGDWKDPAYWGQKRTELLNRTRILLNFSRTRAEYSGLRILLGLANKALVISEPMVDSAPFVPGKHFVEASPEQMPTVIRHYLQHEEERRQVAEQGHRFAVIEHTMQRTVDRILQLAVGNDWKEVRVGEAIADSGGADLRT